MALLESEQEREEKFYPQPPKPSSSSDTTTSSEPEIPASENKNKTKGNCEPLCQPRRNPYSFQWGNGDVNVSPQFQMQPPEYDSFHLDLIHMKNFKNNIAQELTYRLRLKDGEVVGEVPDVKDLESEMIALFDNLLEHTKKEMQSEDIIVRIFINHPLLASTIIVEPTYVDELSGEKIMTHVVRCLTSAGYIPADNRLKISVGVIKVIQGRHFLPILDLLRDIKLKKSMIEIRNNDALCMIRAIVVAYARLHKDDSSEAKKHYEDIRKPTRSYQTKETLKLMSKVGLPTNRCGRLEDIPIYERELGVSITVASTSVCNERIYEGDRHYKDKLYLHHFSLQGKEHYNVLTKVNAMFNMGYFCINCWKPFSSKEQHACETWCSVCRTEDCMEEEDSIENTEPITCQICNRLCKSEKCFISHQERGQLTRGKRKGEIVPSQCDKFWKCPTCTVTLKVEKRNPDNHECGEQKCIVCKEYHIDAKHLCFMRAEYKKHNESTMIFYDFECHQESDQHIPNFAIAQSVCDNCEDEPVTNNACCDECGTRCIVCSRYNNKTKQYERDPCKGCGKRQVEFSGSNTATDFCKWLLDHKHKPITAIAHNSRAYDAYFIYKHCLDNGIIPEFISNGTKLMYMKINKGVNIRILDSLNFLPMPLCNLPNSFGLKEMKKGFFPHFFNIPENQNVIIPHLPDKKYYSPDTMSEERRTEFLDWYEKNQNCTFDFQKEMRDYCISDVDILLQSCLKFRHLVMEATGQEIKSKLGKTKLVNSVDPFSSITIASVCLSIFRSNFLSEQWKVLTKTEAEKNPECNHEWNCECTWLEARKKNSHSGLEVNINDEWVPLHNYCKPHLSKFVSSSIGLIPPGGYSASDNHSKQALQWLYLYESKIGDGTVIQTARAPQGEKVIYCFTEKGKRISYKVDGYFVDKNGVEYICEFNGCNWHGCPKCFPRNRSLVCNGKSLDQKYAETVLKEKRLKQAGYKVITKWSCVFQAEVARNPEDAEKIELMDIQDPINIREGYSGGRVEPTILHYDFKEGEKGHYIDFTSLYPDVMKNNRYPVGHPERIVVNFEHNLTVTCDDDCETCSGQKHVIYPYFGFVKVKILPPQNLLHPVLPLKIDGKLKFVLCYKCAKTNNQNLCNCTDEERSFIGTFCTPEIEMALNKGYKILKTYEVLNWKKTELYSPETKDGGIFSGYVNTFLKIKQESSNYPREVVTQEQKEKYISDYFQKEGIVLNPDKIAQNPGLRQVAKLALNSLYGKFGQKNIKKKSKITNDIGDLFDIWRSYSLDLCDWHIMNENMLGLEYKENCDFETLSLNSNVVISAFCTCWARLKLFKILYKLGERVLYYDTDSVIYRSMSEDTYTPPLGNYLGELTNELSCKDVGCKTLECEGHWITEFIGCGPKNYSYKLNTGQVICKVRGFTLNHEGSQILNFESMKQSLEKFMKNEEEELVIVKTQICRNKQDPCVYNKVVSKRYSTVFDKRKILPNFTSVPYGYNVEK